MTENKNYIFRFRKRMQVFNLFHLIVLLTGVILLFVFLSNQSYIFLILSISLFLMNFTIHFLANYFGWNSFIYFGEAIIKQKIRGKEYIWNWEELISCEIKFVFVRTPAMLHMIFSNSSKVLKFEITLHRERIFLEKCPNEQARKLLKKTFL